MSNLCNQKQTVLRHRLLIPPLSADQIGSCHWKALQRTKYRAWKPLCSRNKCVRTKYSSMCRNSLLFRILHWAEWWEATLFTSIKRFLCSINPSKTEVKPAAPSTLKESLDRNSRLSSRAVRPEVASNSYSFAESATMKRTVNSTRNMKVNIIWATKTTWSFNLSGKACKDDWNIWRPLGHLWLQSKEKL